MKVVLPFVRNPYNYDRDAVSNETGLCCEDESLTQQSFAEESDINYIVRRYGITGQLPEGVVVPSYGEFEEVFDFQSAMNVVRKAEEAFMEMPAEVRIRFGHDPGRFVDFASDPANLEECRKLGLAPAAPVAAPVAPERVPGSPSPPPGTVSSSPSDVPKAP